MIPEKSINFLQLNSTIKTWAYGRVGKFFARNPTPTEWSVMLFCHENLNKAYAFNEIFVVEKSMIQTQSFDNFFSNQYVYQTVGKEPA